MVFFSIVMYANTLYYPIEKGEILESKMTATEKEIIGMAAEQKYTNKTLDEIKHFLIKNHSN